MGAALKLARSQPLLPTAPMPVDPVRLLPDYARMEAERCLAIIRPALNRVAQGVSVKAASQWLATSAEGMPSAPTIARWLKQYLTGGLVDLAPKYQPRQRKVYGWEARALELYNRPQRPAYATVALWLRQEGFEGASEHNVRRYLKAAPSNLAETGKKRLGAHYYAQNIKPHVIRDNTVVPVGFIYEGDGHCCDVYVAHPARGHFRPELTTWIDIRSHYLVSWWISESESAHTTLFSLSQALVAYDHVPAYAHTDPGSGFKAKLISDEVTGFLQRFGITSMLALPGNAKGKGLQEGWFRWFEERCGKRFATFCGHCRTDDDLCRLSAKIKRGDIELPTLQQYIDAVRQYIHDYNHAPQESLGGKTPAELWAQLERVPLHTTAEAIIRPRKQCAVRRWTVRLDNRRYRASELAQYEQRDVVVEYSLHHDDRVWIHDVGGRFICEAQLVEKKAWLPQSRIDEAQQRRLEGQRQRHERAIAEQEARALSPLPIATAAAVPALADGNHSIGAPVAPRFIAPSAPRLDERAAEILTELQQRAPVALPAPRRAINAEDEVAARFARAQRVEQQLAAGDAIETDLAWLNRYRATAEYRGQMRFLQSFGRGPTEHDIPADSAG